MTMAYNVICNTGETLPDGTTKYALLSFRDRTEWKTRRIAEQHARDYKANHMRDAWAEEA